MTRPVRFELLGIMLESLKCIRAQPVFSALTVAIVAAMCASVALTVGKTAGATAAIQDSLNTAGARTIVVTASTEAELDPSLVQRISGLSSVEWVGAFGAPADVRSVGLSDGRPVAAREGWMSENLNGRMLEPSSDTGAWITPQAKEALQLTQAAGAVETASGHRVSIMGSFDTSAYLDALEPLVLLPRASTDTGVVTSVVIVVRHASQLTATLEAASALLDPKDASKITLKSSDDLARLQVLVSSELGRHGFAITMAALGVSGTLIAGISFGIVILRRRELGRRRALGASQSFVLKLLVIQNTMLSTFGGILGSVAGVCVLAVSNDPPPPLHYLAALAVAATLTTSAFALLPAWHASRRDPVAELRLP